MHGNRLRHLNEGTKCLQSAVHVQFLLPAQPYTSLVMSDLACCYPGLDINLCCTGLQAQALHSLLASAARAVSGHGVAGSVKCPGLF